jgi:hypothetical protein
VIFECYVLMILLSSHLLSLLVAPEVNLAHNVSWPLDDIVVGSWIQQVAPAPITQYIHDPEGFHDPPDHGWVEKARVVDWDNVVIHHITPEDMYGLRKLEQYKDEFEA